MLSGGAPTPAGTSVFTKSESDLGMRLGVGRKGGKDAQEGRDTF